MELTNEEWKELDGHVAEIQEAVLRRDRPALASTILAVADMLSGQDEPAESLRFVRKMVGEETAGWNDIDRDVLTVQEAVLGHDRISFVDGILGMAEALTCHEKPAEGCYFFDGDMGIVTEDWNEAETLADYFDDLYGEPVCVTGSWEVDEDIREGCVDDMFTGHGYVGHG